MDYKPLIAIQPNEKNLYGSKALHLATLMSNDIPVPDGYAFSTAFTSRVAEQGYQMTGGDREALSAVYEQMGNAPIAVRSSGILEDLEGESFAGQYDTVLDVVSYEDFEAAVLQCIKSSFSEHASTYSTTKAGEETRAIAIIAQQMIQGDAAGVLFTANPLSQNRNEVVINGMLGYGFGVVDGTSKLEAITADKTSATILQTENAIPVDSLQSKLGRNSLFTKALLDKLVLAGRIIEGIMGAPQDIEWVIQGDELFILQTRNITTLYPIEEEHLAKDKLRLYLCYNSVVQGMTEPYTPLGYDFWRCTFAGYTSIYFNRKKKILYPNWIRYINGRLHYDLTEVLGRRFIGPSFLKSLDDKDPDGGKLLKELFRLNRPTFLKQGGKFKLSYGIVKWGLALTKYGKISRTDYKKGLEEALAIGENYVQTVEVRAKKATTLEDRILLLGDVTEELLTEAFKQVMYVAYGLKAFNKWEQWFAKHYPDVDINPFKLAIHNNPTTDMGVAIMEAAIQLDKNRIEPTVDEPVIQHLIKKYGHRSDLDTDMGVARWSEKPEQIVHMVKHYMRNDATAYDDDVEAHDSSRRYSSILAEQAFNKYKQQQKDAGVLLDELTERIRKDHSDKKAKQFYFDICNYRTLVGLRELPKFNMVRCMAILRNQFLEVGDEFVAKGFIESRDDITYLFTKDMLTIETINAKALVEERKKAYAYQKSFTSVPRFILSTGELFYNSALTADASNTNALTGTPLSAGRVTGPVKILNSPFEAPIGSDHILVTHNTDPSWTPLFPTIKGLIMESGGPISHGAIVAREYGLPAVGGVPNAASILKDGDIVEIDGKTGTVLIK